jgi:meiotically up-regulated gene 157 (Mug157) protein
MVTLMVIWFLAIVLAVVTIDSQLQNAPDNSFLRRAPNIGVRRRIGGGNNNNNNEFYRSKQFPKYPINHRNDVSTTTLSPEAVTQCHKALWHTLETTTFVLPNDETFVITGDIKDMWLRDSAAQIHPLLLPNTYDGKSLVQLDQRLERVVSGLILKTAKLIREDPYANAFASVIKNRTKFERNALGRHGYVATRNYELDSGCYFMRMLYFFCQSFPKHAVLRRKEVREAVQIMVDLWIAEQRHELDAYPSGELFDCFECGRSYWYNPNQMPRDGKGTKTNATSGLTWSGFRPSDDVCIYGYIIPANMFTVVVLEYMLKLNSDLWNDKLFMKKATKLKNEIQDGIDRYGTVYHEKYGKIYAYEVDGFGNYFLMDDANVPSLLSIPYLGYSYDEEIYANTKRFIFSADNPSYHKGFNRWTGEIEGIGSSHAHHLWEIIPDDIWPMSIIMQGLVSNNVTEKINLVHKLLQASASTGKNSYFCTHITTTYFIILMLLCTDALF